MGIETLYIFINWNNLQYMHVTRANCKKIIEKPINNLREYLEEVFNRKKGKYEELRAILWNATVNQFKEILKEISKI